ncbi:uncharacterized protein LOC108669404 isoform X2 [Hyalella azteca]|uniref:Uncharacterized protein LOC108669404 isoform X2 n=1 Tax=Hyalella azteca TaxID=294128 RepID=A0A8B7NFK0_HYAAZ|nr:uncharacterized protein LOC108669404 isoform X2 [Hyalella azteca]
MITCLLVFMAFATSGVTAIMMEATGQVVAVENGTVSAVVLDCPYSLGPDDLNGLVLKWFFNHSDQPIYTWILDGDIDEPQVSGLPPGTVDTSYKHHEDPRHRHRALRLLAPTPASSGDYTCVVSSHYDEKTHVVPLMVYVLPLKLEFSVEETTSGNITVSCSAEPAYPEPRLQLYVQVDDVREPLKTIADRETVYEDGVYNTSLRVELPLQHLELYGDASLICELHFPHTNVSMQESIDLRPEVEEEVSQADSPALRAVVHLGSTPSAASRQGVVGMSVLGTWIICTLGSLLC